MHAREARYMSPVEKHMSELTTENITGHQSEHRMENRIAVDNREAHAKVFEHICKYVESSLVGEGNAETMKMRMLRDKYSMIDILWSRMAVLLF